MKLKPMPLANFRADVAKGASPDAILMKAFTPQSVDTLSDGRVKFVVSNGSEDRDGDTVDPAGWVLDHYKKNPIVLFGHDQDKPPIGISEKIWIEGGALKSVCKFVPREVYEFGGIVGDMVRGGYIKGTSVGFHPMEYEMRKGGSRADGKGVAFNKQELYEYSIVPVPSNRDSLIEAKRAGIDILPVADWVEDFLVVQRKAIESEGGSTRDLEVIEKALQELRGPMIVVPGVTGMTKRAAPPVPPKKKPQPGNEDAANFTAMFADDPEAGHDSGEAAQPQDGKKPPFPKKEGDGSTDDADGEGTPMQEQTPGDKGPTLEEQQVGEDKQASEALAEAQMGVVPANRFLTIPDTLERPMSVNDVLAEQAKIDTVPGHGSPIWALMDSLRSIAEFGGDRLEQLALASIKQYIDKAAAEGAGAGTNAQAGPGSGGGQQGDAPEGQAGQSNDGRNGKSGPVKIEEELKGLFDSEEVTKDGDDTFGITTDEIAKLIGSALKNTLDGLRMKETGKLPD